MDVEIMEQKRILVTAPVCKERLKNTNFFPKYLHSISMNNHKTATCKKRVLLKTTTTTTTSIIIRI